MTGRAVRAAAAAALALLLYTSPAPAAGKPNKVLLERWLSTGQVHNPDDPFRQRTVVLLHGFGGSPYDMKPLFDALQDEGFRIVAPLLPGEGPGAERAEPPAVAELADWLFGLLDGETQGGRRPYLVGFSKGGTLASLAAAEARAARVVLVAPFFGLPHGGTIAEAGSRMAAPLIDTVPKPWKGRIDDPAGYRSYEPGQKDVSLKSFLRLQELSRRARDVLAGPIPVPLLVLASPDDDVASFKETSRIFSGRSDAVLKSYPGSNHILFYDYAAVESVDAVRTFLTEQVR